MSQDLLACQDQLQPIADRHGGELPTVPGRDFARRCDQVFGTTGTFERTQAYLPRRRRSPRGSGPSSTYEARATALRGFEHVLVPGLAQTAGYARAVLATPPGATAERWTSRHRARLERHGDPGPRQACPRWLGGADDGLARSARRPHAAAAHGRMQRQAVKIAGRLRFEARTADHWSFATPSSPACAELATGRSATAVLPGPSAGVLRAETYTLTTPAARYLPAHRRPRHLDQRLLHPDPALPPAAAPAPRTTRPATTPARSSTATGWS